MKRLLTLLILSATLLSAHAQQNPDTERLGKALEYFSSQKYGEALAILAPLDKHYKLNDRFRAYIGLCYYYEWDYKKAVLYFDHILPRLSMLSPHELSVYKYAAGESYFQMGNYEQALDYFKQDLALCYDNEKGDVLYRIGLCHMKLEQWREAIDAYTGAEKYLSAMRNPDDVKARLAQTATMRKGCLARLSQQIAADQRKGKYAGNYRALFQSLAQVIAYQRQQK